MSSRYNCSNISGSQQYFLTETVLCIVERWKKRMGYRVQSRKGKSRMSIFSFFCHICRTTVSATVATRRHAFSPLLEAFSPGRISAYCWALILRQLLEEGVSEVSPLGHFSFGFHFYQKPILTSPPAALIFRYRGHGEASINDIAWSSQLYFNPCRKNFC